MKNFQQNLLIGLAIALCLLCAWQWRDQALQRADVEKQSQLVSQQLVAIQGYTNSIATLQSQLSQTDVHITELRNTIRTNDDFILAQKRELNRIQSENETFTNQIAQYKKAIDTYKDKLTEVYDGVKKQNEAMTNLIAQRDDFVQKLNASVQARNDIVAKYNALVTQVEKLQSAKQ